MEYKILQIVNLFCTSETYIITHQLSIKGFPHSSVSKSSACNAGDLGSIPRSRRSPGEGNGNPLQYSCLGNPMDREAWQAIVHRIPRVRHNLVTKPPPPYINEKKWKKWIPVSPLVRHLGKLLYLYIIQIASRMEEEDRNDTNWVILNEWDVWERLTLIPNNES